MHLYQQWNLTYRHTFTSIVVSSADLVLPPAFLLRCFSCMSMKCLIPSRCVCSGWHRLLLRSDLHSTRPRFLELHYKMLANPLFSSSGARTPHPSASIRRHSGRAMLDARGGDPRKFSDVHLRMACSHADWVYVARSSTFRL